MESLGVPKEAMYRVMHVLCAPGSRKIIGWFLLACVVLRCVMRLGARRVYAITDPLSSRTGSCTAYSGGSSRLLSQDR